MAGGAGAPFSEDRQFLAVVYGHGRELPPSAVLSLVARRWGVPPPVLEYYLFEDGSWGHWYAKELRIMQLEQMHADARQHRDTFRTVSR